MGFRQQAGRRDLAKFLEPAHLGPPGPQGLDAFILARDKSSRMAAIIVCLHGFNRQAAVILHGADAGKARQFLDGPQIRPSVEQVLLMVICGWPAAAAAGITAPAVRGTINSSL